MTMVRTVNGESVPIGPGEVLPMSREETIDFALLGIAVRLTDLERTLEENDFRRLPGLRTFLDAGKSLVSDLGYAER